MKNKIPDIQLGRLLKKAIHAIVDAAPISATAKQKIKDCPACQRRAARLDRLTKFKRGQ